MFQCDDITEDNLEATFISIKQLSVLAVVNADVTNFIWNSPEAICVPAEFYSEELALDYANITYGDYPGVKTYMHELDNVDVLAATTSLLQQTAADAFNGAVFYHHHYCLLSSIPGDDKPVIYLYFYPGSFTVSAFKNGQLQVVQTRPFTTAEEVLYFVLNVYKQYGFVQEETQLLTAGFIDPQSSLYELLYQYMAGIHIQQPHGNLVAQEVFGEYQPHVYLPFCSLQYMRIISGTLGGRKINPPTKMPYTRPTTDIAKEGLFNILQNRINFDDAKTLDLFWRHRQY